MSFWGLRHPPAASDRAGARRRADDTEPRSHRHRDPGNALPIELTLLVTVLTNDLINRMASGMLSYIAPETVGRGSLIPAMVWGLGIVFIAYAIVIVQIF